MDTDSNFCLKGGDMFGTGAVSCLDSLTCLGKCLSAPAASDGGAALTDAAAAATTSSSDAGTDEGGVPSVGDLTTCASECGGSSADAGTGDAGPVDPLSAAATGLGNLVGGVGNLLLAPIDILLGKPIGGAPDTCTPCLQQKCGDVLNACVNDKTCNY